MRNRIYLSPELYDLSQGSRIKFVRIFRHLTQDNVSDDLGITGKNKRRTLTRYEKRDRNPRGRDQFKAGHITRAEHAGHRDPGCLLLKWVLGKQI